VYLLAEAQVAEFTSHPIRTEEVAMTNVVTLRLSKPASNRRRLTKLCAWIDANIEKQIGWTELVQQSGVDHVELQRLFNIYYKTSPMQWIRNRRAESKKSLLVDFSTSSSQLPASLKTMAR
jgi:transcriptional regulator GlxA family with amidase domain